jgi:hypothetical protein
MELWKKLEDTILKTEAAHRECGMIREFLQSKTQMNSRKEIVDFCNWIRRYDVRGSLVIR